VTASTATRHTLRPTCFFLVTCCQSHWHDSILPYRQLVSIDFTAILHSISAYIYRPRKITREISLDMPKASAQDWLREPKRRSHEDRDSARHQACGCAICVPPLAQNVVFTGKTTELVPPREVSRPKQAPTNRQAAMGNRRQQRTALGYRTFCPTNAEPCQLLPHTTPTTTTSSLPEPCCLNEVGCFYLLKAFMHLPRQIKRYCRRNSDFTLLLQQKHHVDGASHTL